MIEIIEVTKMTNLKQLRAEVVVTQEAFAHQAGLKLKTYRLAEWHKNTSYTTAISILTEMNRLRAEKGLSILTLEELGLKIV